MTIEASTHNMSNLFSQLGLPNDPDSIQAFFATHGKLDSNVLITEASFWTAAQATFLKEEILMDADWAAVIDELNVALHANGPDSTNRIIDG